MRGEDKRVQDQEVLVLDELEDTLDTLKQAIFNLASAELKQEANLLIQANELVATVRERLKLRQPQYPKFKERSREFLRGLCERVIGRIR